MECGVGREEQVFPGQNMTGGHWVGHWVTETGYMYFETGKLIRGLVIDSVIIMTGKTETNPQNT